MMITHTPTQRSSPPHSIFCATDWLLSGLWVTNGCERKEEKKKSLPLSTESVGFKRSGMRLRLFFPLYRNGSDTSLVPRSTPRRRPQSLTRSHYTFSKSTSTPDVPDYVTKSPSVVVFAAGIHKVQCVSAVIAQHIKTLETCIFFFFLKGVVIPSRRGRFRAAACYLAV